MAQVWTAKQQNWIQRFSNATVGLMANADAIGLLCTEFNNDFYGTGGANAITDATVQLVLPAASALLLNEAEGAMAGTNQILAIIATNRGYLEMMRP